MFRTLLLLGTAASLAFAAAKPVDFQREVRPILSENCFQCHGPDSGTRMAGLRLDRKETAFAVIQPGDPEHSKLAQRISEPNAARRMPPQASHKSLTPQQ